MQEQQVILMEVDRKLNTEQKEIELALQFGCANELHQAIASDPNHSAASKN